MVYVVILFRVGKTVAVVGILAIIFSFIAIVVWEAVIGESIPLFSLTAKLCLLLGVSLWVAGSYLMARYGGARELFEYALWVVGGCYVANILFSLLTIVLVMLGSEYYDTNIAILAITSYVALWITLMFVAKFYGGYAAILEKRFNSKTAKKSSKLMWRGSLLALVGIGILLMFFAWLLAAIAIIEAREPLTRPLRPKIEEVGEEA
ncbi:MAG TPA: hypothetical protein EYH08_06105 [Pyrodictium sp.]|nr:hypothetical protein [Pyrodictium sp.]